MRSSPHGVATSSRVSTPVRTSCGSVFPCCSSATGRAGSFKTSGRLHSSGRSCAGECRDSSAGTGCASRPDSWGGCAACSVRRRLSSLLLLGRRRQIRSTDKSSMVSRRRNATRRNPGRILPSFNSGIRSVPCCGSMLARVAVSPSRSPSRVSRLSLRPL